MAVAVGLVLGVAAFPAGSAGAAAGKIAIGSTGPFTAAGAPADVLRGEQAYFRFVNARGGVNGRQIEFELIDDGGDASRAATNARRLIERDGVFALFSVVGSEASLSVRDVAAAAHVPEVFSAATARALGSGSLTTGSLATGYPPSEFEVAEIYAEHLLAADSTHAKVGVLYADGVDGQDALAGFRQGLGKQGFGKQGAALLVASESVGSTATDVTAALQRLQASGANTLALFVPGGIVLAAYPELAAIGWQPQVYVGTDVSGTPFPQLTSSPAAEGSISALWARDPATARFAHDPGAKLARQILARYGTGSFNGAVVAGMAAAFSLADALKDAGATPTRTSLLASIAGLNEVSNPFLVPGVEVHMAPGRRFPVTQLVLVRRQAGRWVPFGGIQSAAT
jgi:branched-chain amino acid transport system substrate-binding protein